MEGEALAEEHEKRRGGTYFAECSLLNGFGLKFIHRFLNVPFLQMLRATLERQLADNLQELQTTSAELQLATSTTDQDYAKYDVFEGGG